MPPSSALVDLGRPPGSDEIEVSLFGPGYGEAVAVHVGDNQWILVDSCIQPGSAGPSSLDYLKRLGVDVQEAVKLVVATHWHDDHVRGISTVFRECASARFYLSAALQNKDFLALLALYESPTLPESSGVDELTGVVRAARALSPVVRNQSLRFALADRLLWSAGIPVAPNQSALALVYSLSPSDASVLQAQMAFAQMFPQPAMPRRRVPLPSTNDAAVALWLQIGDRRVLLGADLERSEDPGRGWSAVLDSSYIVTAPAEVYKVSHHGAASGDDPRVWDELVEPDSRALLTPFLNGGTILPTETDRERIRAHTPHAFITAGTRRKRHKWENRVVREMVQATVRSIENAEHGWGHVRVRSRLSSNPATWQVELFGDAAPL